MKIKLSTLSSLDLVLDLDLDLDLDLEKFQQFLKIS